MEEEHVLRLLRKRRERRRERRWGDEEAVRWLTEFAHSREGVEGYVEPQTMVADTTVVFIAASGEWTRRRVAGPREAEEMGRHLGVPVYDASKVGYPARMRAWTRQQSDRQRPDNST